MAQFATTESDVLTLAQETKSGLAANTDVYPRPPVSPAILLNHIDEFNNRRTTPSPPTPPRRRPPPPSKPP